MCFRMFARPLMGFLAVILTCAASGFAQSDTASLSGTVLDPQGRPVPEVEVKATRIETGNISISTTNSVGIYFFSSLVPATIKSRSPKQALKRSSLKVSRFKSKVG